MAETDWERELVRIEGIDQEAGRNWRNLLDEAAVLADAVDRHWRDEVLGDGGVRVGLAGTLPASTASELREIGEELERAVNHHALAVDLEDGELGPCAEFVFSELTSALAFLAEHGGGPGTLEVALGRLLTARLNEAETDAARAARLAECGHLAAAERAHLGALPDFDAALIDDALGMAEALRARGRGAERSAEVAAALLRRDQLATLLTRRLAHVRRTAWFVFRHHREVQRAFPGPSARPNPLGLEGAAVVHSPGVRSTALGQRRRSG